VVRLAPPSSAAPASAPTAVSRPRQPASCAARARLLSLLEQLRNDRHRQEQDLDGQGDCQDQPLLAAQRRAEPDEQAVAEHLAVRLSDLLPPVDVGDVHAGPHDVRQLGAGLLQRGLDAA